MNKNKILKMFIGLLLVLAFCCIAFHLYKYYTPAEVKTAFIKDSDVFAINTLSLDSTYDKAKEIYPDISPLQSQNGGLSTEKSVFTEAFADVQMINYPARAKFNFHYGKLYNYCFDFLDMNKTTAVQLYDEITRTVIPVYNEPEKQLMELDNESSQTNFWHTNNYSVALTITTTDSKNYKVSLGYNQNQISRPTAK